MLFPGPNANTPGVIPVSKPPTEVTDQDFNTSWHNGSSARIAVDRFGYPLVFLLWADPDKARVDGKTNLRVPRSLWVSRVDPVTGAEQKTELLPPMGDWDVGECHVTYNKDGVVAVVVAQSNDHSFYYFPTFSDTSSNYGDNRTAPGQLAFYLFITTDGVTWDRYIIDDGTNRISGAYIDLESLRLDSKLRIYPCFSKEPSRAEVWEIDLVSWAAAEHPTPTVVTPIATGGPGQITITWPAIADGQYPLRRYEVYSNAPPGSGAWRTVTNNILAVNHTGLAAGDKFTYRVQAVNEAGAWSPVSPVVSASALDRNAENRSTKSPWVPTVSLRADRILDTQIGDRVTRWDSYLTAVNVAATQLSSDPASSAPILVDGPAGRTALRFERGTRLQLPLDINTENGLTIFMVVRLLDGDDSYILSSLRNGIVIPQGPDAGPQTVTNMSEHDVLLAGMNIYMGASTGPRAGNIANLPHISAGPLHRGRWVVLTCRWSTLNGGHRFVAGHMDDFAGVDSNDPGARTASALLIGSDPSGTFTSAVDIAELVIINFGIGQEGMTSWYNYLRLSHNL